ncbi:hypothetical protein ASPVEDRAFT_55646 [Aspergillus versicolor CBS 583.65]|uniref:Beta-lactamase-related domain-containing protein n=1 Tax=Aspergillus versicolor CBS 583.65 TaxID=1036611 RepID=A0A1L9PWF5_ASPVE|nr:uncharacterized protein ASPVEDRAFT_55646 [Aspergillus versicolor CBS 583.65]OJJ05861.1 hypothetical protein ASPVEDRAFT_55646 [Aspergillus versicolor CBS 583.65]
MELLESTTLAALVEVLLAQNNIPGLCIAVVHNDEVACKGYGVANYEDNISCTGDTLFDIASCSKSLTAAAAALLVDDQKFPKVQYTALMSDLLPDDFVMPDPTYTTGITLEDVLSHRTGMASHDSSYMGIKSSNPDTPKSITRNLRNLKPAAPLRSRYLYCNQMYTVATHLIEETTQQSFADVLQERIFNPLNMTSTTLQPAATQAKGWSDRMAKGYIWENNTWRSLPPQNCPEAQGAGSVISSGNDFIKWVKALLYHEGPITDKVYHGLTTLRSIVNPNGRRLRAHTTPAIYAAGMEIYYYRGVQVIGHDGREPGFASRFVFMPALRFGAVVLGNSAGAGQAATVIIRALMDEILGVAVEERPSYKKESKAKHVAKNTKAPQTNKPNQRNKDRDYWNPGYRHMTLQVKDEHLFVDATDRSMGFTLTFHHVKDQTEYTAILTDEVELTDEAVEAEFVFKDGKAIKMGLDLEPTIKELIWFEKFNTM